MRWQGRASGKRGRRMEYWEEAIQFCMTVKRLFRLALRQGFVASSVQCVIPKPRSELWHRHRHSLGCAQPGDPIEDGGTDLQFGDLAVTVTRHDPFTKQSEASHPGLDKAEPVIGAPLL